MTPAGKRKREGATEEDDFAFNGGGLHADSMIVLWGQGVIDVLFIRSWMLNYRGFRGNTRGNISR